MKGGVHPSPFVALVFPNLMKGGAYPSRFAVLAFPNLMKGGAKGEGLAPPFILAFPNLGRLRQRKERDGLRLSS